MLWSWQSPGLDRVLLRKQKEGFIICHLIAANWCICRLQIISLCTRSVHICLFILRLPMHCNCQYRDSFSKMSPCFKCQYETLSFGTCWDPTRRKEIPCQNPQKLLSVDQLRPLIMWYWPLFMAMKWHHHFGATEEIWRSGRRADDVDGKATRSPAILWDFKPTQNGSETAEIEGFGERETERNGFNPLPWDWNRESTGGAPTCVSRKNGIIFLGKINGRCLITEPHRQYLPLCSEECL